MLGRRGVALLFLFLGTLIMVPLPVTAPPDLSGVVQDVQENLVPSQAGWLSGWQHRKTHTIHGSPGAGAGYQVRFTVNFGSGTDSGSNVYCNNTTRADFGDVRFTASDGSTLLDYWLESNTTERATFWVEVAADLDTDQEVCMYYGNPSASSVSNGTATFVFFDDFEDETVGANPDTMNWKSPVGESGDYDVIGITLDPVDAENQVILVKESGDGVTTYVYSKDLTIDRDVALGWKWRRDGVELVYNAFIGTTTEIARWRSPTPYDHLEWRIANSDEYTDFVPAWTDCAADTWYSCEYRFSQEGFTTHSWDDGDTFAGGYYKSYPTTSGYLRYFNVPSSHMTRSNSYWTDDVYIRNYLAPEPTHGSWV
ncbi:MAG: hypothetical protein C4K49_05160, partial [Candidatus Thorarchaeota archaeon]